MRNLLLAILIVAFPALAFGQLHEILRPTVDNSTTSNLGLCIGTNLGSTAMPNAIDASGLSTSSVQTATSLASETSGRFRSRTFITWGTKTQTYTALSLNVNSSNTGVNASGLGDGYVVYSTNSGSTWTVIHQDQNGAGWAQITDTVTLGAGQDLTVLQVGICEDSSGDTVHAGSDGSTVWDIWTDGTYTSGMGKRVYRTSLPRPTIFSMILNWFVLSGRLW